MNSLDLFSDLFKNKKVLITGDTGFKGSWLCIWLKEVGAEVFGYALPPRTNRDNFVAAGLASKVNHLDGDIRDLKKLSGYIKQVAPDIVFHLAAQPLVIEGYNNPHYNFETNLMGTVNIFEAVRTCPSVKIAINITSDKCYQNNEWPWGYREIDPMGGDDPYSASKGCSELITNSYIKSFFSKENTIHAASARAGNVIGGGDWAENRIIPDIMKAYESHTTAVIRNPNAVRPWQFVLEPLYGYLKLAENLYTHGKKFSGGWNFGPAAYENYTVGNVVNEVKKLIPSVSVDSPELTEKVHEASVLKLDVTKAVNHLRWKPKLSFEETIQFTIEGYVEELNNKNNVYSSRVKQIESFCSK